MKKHRKQANHEENYVKLLNACEKTGCILKEFASRSYRITKLGKPVIDYYTTRSIAFLHDEKKWTEYIDDVKELIEFKHSGKKIYE